MCICVTIHVVEHDNQVLISMHYLLAVIVMLLCFKIEWWINWRLTATWQGQDKNFICHRWKKSSELHNSLIKIKNVWWGYIKVSTIEKYECKSVTNNFLVEVIGHMEGRLRWSCWYNHNLCLLGSIHFVERVSNKLMCN